MHSSNPLLKLDTAQYRQLPFQSGYLTASLSLLPPPPFFFLPILLLHKICSSSSLPPPSALLCLLCSSILFLLPLQPLMTCLKPTVGNTVRQGMEALPSHRPSQQSAVQGKVHARHMVHTLTTHKHTHTVSGRFPVRKNGCTHNCR